MERRERIGLTSFDVVPSTTRRSHEANRSEVILARASSPNSEASSTVVIPHSANLLAVLGPIPGTSRTERC